MGDARGEGRGGLTIPGGPGLVSAALVFEAILDSNTGSAALERLAKLPRTDPRSIEIPVKFVALQEVMNELLRQDAKWGEQNHPDGTDPRNMPLISFVTQGGFSRAEDLAEKAKSVNDTVSGIPGAITWADILLEEVFEALAEAEGTDELRTELLQVAAVAVQWVLAMDRRRADG